MAGRRTARSTSATVGQLSEAQIVQAALRLAARSGADDVSMRTLAAELGVSPMAIYYYVPNKDALLDLIIDAVLRQVELPPPDPVRWRQQLKTTTMQAFDLLRGYPNLSRTMLLRKNTKAGRALAGHHISILLAAGFDQREAALAISAFSTYMYGVFAMFSAPPPREKAGATRKAEARAEGVRGVVQNLRELPVEEAVEFGIDAMLTGIGATLADRSRARQHDL